MKNRALVGSMAVAGVVAVIVVACAADISAQAAQSSGVVIPDDTAKVARLLSVVRGADPLVCEVTRRSVDNQGWWSSWGSIGGDPLETDSASAALLRWLHAEHNDPVVVPRLRAGVRDADGCVRRVSAALLAHVRHPSAINALMDALGDSRAEVRDVAAIGLGLAEHKAAVGELISRLKDSAAPVRRSSAWALGSIEDKRALPALLQLLANDTDARVRLTAAWAIGNLH